MTNKGPLIHVAAALRGQPWAISWVFQGTAGVARISFDYGATWRQITTRRASTQGGALGVDYPVDIGLAVPLFPYSG